ncbi:carbon-nitrogen hydrolase [Mucilaginibacter sp. cycad4]|uniref:carbon-nitrogen hydrolase n=1 Tax=Mucilaginibacter sp. cycad4 TaxID=3342096 RepID=UPI002AAB97B6|nr:carbon-nitrogen hydrolase [Mucilaginibacter gossypii]WPU99154.1 carbon-nitrogen hydrolase [Mucilaginibacter gossypii]
MAKVQIGQVQMKCIANKQENLEKAILMIRDAASKGAQIICLPELFTTAYFLETEDPVNFEAAEPVPGQSTQTLSMLSAELGVVIVASFFELDNNGKYYNTAAVIDADGKYLGKYRKMHIADTAELREKFYFSPGDEGYKVFKTQFATIGVLIGWDQWYPEATRIVSLMGAELLICPTSLGWSVNMDATLGSEQIQGWQTIVRGHAVANAIPIVSTNKVGEEAGIKFSGNSLLTDAFGGIVRQGSIDNEEVIVQQVDTDDTEHYRIHWPFFRDRRIDSYAELTKRSI